jgi:cell wall-associated NlpC family hydrolase
VRAPGRTPEDVLNRTAPRRAAIAASAALMLATSASVIPSISASPAADSPAAANPLPFTVALPARFTVTGREEHAASRGQLERPYSGSRPHRPVQSRKTSARPAHRVAARRAEHHSGRAVHRRRAHAIPAAAGRLSAVVAYGRSQLGDPYVYGGAGPGGWDCSGLTKAAYARIGVDLPHKAAEQARRGVAVARSRARPGDLVVWGSHHVGIYVGAGRVLHAPRPGETVRVAPLWGSPTFRRVAHG